MIKMKTLVPALMLGTGALLMTGCKQAHEPRYFYTDCFSNTEIVKNEDPLISTEDVTHHNDSVVQLYKEKIKEDSINCISANEALKNINLAKLEKNYDEAVKIREKAKQEVEIAQNVRAENIVNEKKQKMYNIIENTQQAVDAYNNALELQHIASGQDIKRNIRNLKKLHKLVYICNATKNKLYRTFVAPEDIKKDKGMKGGESLIKEIENISDKNIFYINPGKNNQIKFNLNSDDTYYYKCY